MEKKTNEVADRISELYRNIKIAIVIILILACAMSVIFRTIDIFIIGIIGITILIMLMYSLMTKAEIIQKLHDIEINTRK